MQALPKVQKDEALKLGPQALDPRLPFGELEVLADNSELIKRQLGLKHVEVLSAADPDALAKADDLVSLCESEPALPWKPYSRLRFTKHQVCSLPVVCMCHLKDRT